MIEVSHLTKKYGSRLAVDDISFTVEDGVIYGLLGPNGAGKSTTFYMVVGIVPRDAGNIIIDDDDISLLPLHARARRGIGYLPQEASIFRRLSVYDNLMAVLQIRDDLSAEQREDRANELMEEFHIEHLRDSGLGVLITDHNVRETLAVCERAYIVSQGHLIAHGTPTEILQDEHVKRVYLGEDFRL